MAIWGDSRILFSLILLLALWNQPIGRAKELHLEQLSPQVLFVQDLAFQLPFLNGTCYTSTTDAEVCANCAEILLCFPNSTSMSAINISVPTILSPFIPFSIPPIIGNITSLISIRYFAQNMFNTTIPTELGWLTGLTELRLAANSLNGTIPTEIGLLTNLETVTLQLNFLTGTIPTEIGKLVRVTDLNMFQSRFEGQIPTEIGNLLMLDSLDLSGNLLNGSIPTEISGLSLLTYLSLSTNFLTGSIPPIPSTVTTLFLNFNFLNSSLPVGFESNNWQYLFLNTNSLSGTLPPLKINGFASFASNKFSGAIPGIIGNISDLDFSTNQFSNFSDAFLADPTLRATLVYLDVGSNKLTDLPRKILEQNSSFQNNISSLLLGNNAISGTFPQYFISPRLRFVDFSSNIIEGFFRLQVNCADPVNPCDLLGQTLNPTQYHVLASQNRFYDERGVIEILGALATLPDTTPSQLPFFTVNLGAQDENECTDGTHQCQQVCVEGWFPVGGYQCACFVGFTLDSNLRNCSLVQSATALIVGLSVTLPLAFILFCLLVALLLWLLLRRKKSILLQLPPDVAASYMDFERKRGLWEFRGVVDTNDVKKGYYFKMLQSDRELEKVYGIMETYLGNRGPGPTLGIVNAQQVYNMALIQSFINTWNTMNTRVQDKDSSAIFSNEGWKEQGTLEEQERRQFTYQHFVEQTQLYPWNREFKQLAKDRAIGSIIMIAHGTDLTVAEKIAQTGFASISSNDAGWYGRGIYFSSSGLYCFPYFCLRKNPVLLLSWVLPGNTYPVIENHLGPNSIEGTSLKPGYNSHYVCTDRNGQIYDPANELKDSAKFNELVIIQESQVLPAYIVEIDKTNFPQLRDHYVREVTLSDLITGTKNIAADELRSSEVISSDPSLIVMGNNEHSHGAKGRLMNPGKTGEKIGKKPSAWSFTTFVRKKVTPSTANREEI